MSASLIQCPACSRQVSAQAVTCIQCGHPLRSRRYRAIGPVQMLAASFLVVAIVGSYKLGLFDGVSLQPQPANAEVIAVKPVIPEMTDAELGRELHAFSLRANRTLPHRPNPMLTLQRIRFEPKPHRLTYDYELNVSAKMSNVDLTTIRPALMKRYCYDEEFQLASSHGVAVTWRYLEMGRVIHEEKIERCEAGLAARY